MRFQIRQVDLMNRNALYYLERFDAFDVIETHIVDRIMQEYWQSSLDANGAFISASTPYQILTHYSNRYQYDFEYLGRFYKERC